MATVCVFPPPEYREVWETISQMRQQLKDPGYHQWPPHVNLLYPFLRQLYTATRQCAPFPITLKQFGTKHDRLTNIFPSMPTAEED